MSMARILNPKQAVGRRDAERIAGMAKMGGGVRILPYIDSVLTSEEISLLEQTA